jgi:hypothetical protein
VSAAVAKTARRLIGKEMTSAHGCLSRHGGQGGRADVQRPGVASDQSEWPLSRSPADSPRSTSTRTPDLKFHAVLTEGDARVLVHRERTTIPMRIWCRDGFRPQSHGRDNPHLRLLRALSAAQGK